MNLTELFVSYKIIIKIFLEKADLKIIFIAQEFKTMLDKERVKWTTD